MSSDRRLREWLAEYGQSLRSALRRAGSQLPLSDLDDLEQEVHIRLWRALKSEREIRQPASWIKQTVMSVTIDALRRASSRGDHLPKGELEEIDQYLPASGEQPPDSVGIPAQWLESRQALERIEAHLSGVAADTGRVIRLYMAGFSTAEIGRLLDWTEAKARNLLYRSLAELKKACEVSDE